ncbi:hypothetical protein V6N12_010697 [Hibiscus sabdariffa]|uniref:Uncharacterized protein n=1 Tax=Hibiscus sabdariffa TaxID=183260 RepID=A0ABR2EMF1_9ROSI
MLPLSPRNSEGTFHAVCTQSPDNLAPHADLRGVSYFGTIRFSIGRQQRGARSYAGVVSGGKKHATIDPVHSLDDVVIEEGDVTVDLSGPFPLVVFSENVHERIDHSMRQTLIV